MSLLHSDVFAALWRIDNNKSILRFKIFHSLDIRTGKVTLQKIRAIRQQHASGPHAAKPKILTQIFLILFVFYCAS